MAAIGARTVSLSELRKGMTARIVRAPEGDDFVRLRELGLTAGTQFRVVKIAPFGDPVEIELRGYRLCLRKRETSGFEVEIV
jgi:ferrous iron transport protein A